MTLIPVILCGGAGARLWPASTPEHPKPFLRLDDGDSLLQKALRRACMIEGVRDIVIAAAADMRDRTLADAAAVIPPDCRVSCILEPVGRNTGPAVAAACLKIMTRDPDAMLLVLPADHVITDTQAYAEAVGRAVKLADSGRIVTFGIRPDRPETGYGYIEAEGETVRRFVEKPDLATAHEYLDSGRFLWNAGMFCFRADIMLGEMQNHCPALLDAVRRNMPEDIEDEFLQSGFAAAPCISIDRAVMEKTNRLAVVPCDIGWSDIGCWNALGDLGAVDGKGNALEGDVLLHDVGDCHVRGSGRVIGMVGVSGLIVVDTPDGLLIAAKDRAQDVRRLYEMHTARKKSSKN